MQEREILYKLLFDMKNDISDLKKLVFELIRSNDLQVADPRPFLALQSPSNREQDLSNYRPGYYESNLAEQHSFDSGDLHTHRPYIVDTPTLKHDSLEVLDTTAEAFINSRAIGAVTTMYAEVIEELREAFRLP